MEIIKLETTNFSRLGDASIDLTKGLNAVTGPNGIGKSTLLEAVVLSLFGASHIRSSSDDLKTWGDSRPWKVAMSFKLNGNMFTTRSTSTTSVVTDSEGKELATGRSSATKWFTDKLGDPDTFKLLHLVSQKEAAEIAKTGGTKLQRHVERLSGAELLEQIVVKAKDKIKYFEAVVDQNPNQDGEVKELQDEVTKLTSDGADLVNHLQKKGWEVEEFTQAFNSADQLYKDQVTKLEDWNHLQQQRQLVESRLSTTKSRVGDMQERLNTLRGKAVVVFDYSLKEELEGHYESALEAVKSWHSQQEKFETYQGNLRAYESGKQQIEAALGELKSGEKEDISPLKDEVDRLSAFKAEAEVLAENLRDKRASLQNKMAAKNRSLSGTHCSECGRLHEDRTEEDVQAIRDELVQLTQTIGGVENDLGSTRDQVLKFENQRQGALKRKHAAEVHNEGVDAAEVRREQLKAQAKALVEPEPVEGPKVELTELLDNRDDLKSRIDDIAQDITAYESHQEELSNTASSLASVEAQLASCQQEVDALPALGPKPEADYSKVSEARDSLQKSKDGYAETQRLLDSNQREIELKKSGLSRLLERQTVRKSAQKDINLLSGLVQYVGERRTEFLTQVWDLITAEASRFCEQVTEGLEGREITSVVRHEKGFKVKLNGNDVPVKLLSGAQEDLVGLSVRLGLQKVLNPASGLLVLDEPTSAMDEVLGMRTMGVIPSLSGQVITVTHKSDEISTADNVVSLGD